MNKFFLLTVISFLLFSFSRLNTVSIQNRLEYKIIKIDSTSNLYILFAKRNDSIFKILSEKVDNSNCDNIIRENKNYSLKIESVFSPNFHEKLEIKSYTFKDSKIKLGTDGSVWDLFTSENIESLCYLN